MVGDLDILSGSGASNFDTDELQELEIPAGELHLKCKLASGLELAFVAEGIAEVMSVAPEQIAPMPNISPLLLGALNFRGKVIWLADLGQFLGEAKPLNTDRADLSVLALTDRQDIILGVAVDSVAGMEWLEGASLRPSEDCPDEMAPFVRGEWLLPEGDGVLRLLDETAIIRSSRWAT
ncbi:chemotaxis protein CheW [Synechococcus sp. PCC 7336]|uniref:chemotaxis protein CheW n=1 Tax=Synechococcus sp. PCC 7336 TaxID=195250 RepID=UPI0003473CFF|nr:chemotaxis protein CheW [Synechococcus sp. PCC 7336]